MVNKSYIKGRRFEYSIKALLEKCGFYVMRTAGSKSKFDLIAIRTEGYTFTKQQNRFLELSAESGENILLIQCKYGQNISKAEREELLSMDNKLRNTLSLIVFKKPQKNIKVYHIGRTLMVDSFEFVEIDKDGYRK